jgi:superfamily II DNA or RNA helicase
MIKALIDIAHSDNSLRPYQIDSKQEIYEAWAVIRSVLFQMPTGTGKTRLFSSIIKDIQKLSVSKRERIGILVLVHRTELIEQIHETLLFKYGVSHGIIKSGYEEDLTMPVQIASVQSLTRRIKQWKKEKCSAP